MQEQIPNKNISHVVEMKGICKYYVNIGETVKANDNIDLIIDKGEFVSLIGKSGSGKSTLLNIIGGLDSPTSGEYYLDGTDISKISDDKMAEIRNTKMGFIFQQYNLISQITVLDNVELPLLYAKINPNERRDRAIEMLEKVGLADKYNKMPVELSGGQQQRVSIARALAGRPSILLADEPTGALDSKTGLEILDIFKQLHYEGKTVLMVTHDNFIATQADRVVRIADGKKDFDGKAEDYARLV